MNRAGVREMTPWLLAGVTAFPVAVLSHELGHWVPFRLFGFRDVTLHYGSVSNATSDEFWRLVGAGQLDAAAAIHPLWQPPIAAMGGLVVTYVTALTCYWYTTRRRPHPFVVALGIIAVARFLGGIVIVVVRLLMPHARPSADETHAVLGMVIPELLLHAVGFALLWLVWWRMPHALPSEGRVERLRALAIGVVAGGVLYIGVLGPRLLP